MYAGTAPVTLWTLYSAMFHLCSENKVDLESCEHNINTILLSAYSVVDVTTSQEY